MRVIIVGGVAVGASTAARLRRLDENAEIIVYEKTGFISYANCGLPYYLSGTIQNKEDLTLQSPKSFYDRFRVSMNVHHEVIAIHPDQKTVTVRNLETNEEFEDTYDKLVLSPGAKPFVPNMNGLDAPNVFTLRSVEDTLRIKDYVTKEQPTSAIIIGGGFIGVEVAENLRELDMDVTIVEAAPQLMAPFDADMASFIHSKIRSKGIQLHLYQAVKDLNPEKNGINVILNDMSIQADMVVLAIGVQPETSLAKDAGLELGLKGSILVNERMETSIPDIYAGGDAVQVKNFVTNQDAIISLAGPANKHGRIIADNICGKDSAYKGSQASSVLKIFDMTAASTGINERTANQLGYKTDKVILSPMDHAGYYPGGTIMTMKILFEKDSYKLLGAQIIGSNGVDKRIDVLATAIRANMSALDLKDLDLAYAPPYSSAKDPVNRAGFMIENIKDNIVKQWYIEDLETLRKKDVTFLDVRTDIEYERGHVEDFRHIPVDDLREKLNEIPKDKPIYLICQSGLRSYIASRILEGHGYTTYNFAGGYRFYASVILDQETSQQATACGMDKR